MHVAYIKTVTFCLDLEVESFQNINEKLRQGEMESESG